MKTITLQELYRTDFHLSHIAVFVVNAPDGRVTTVLQPAGRPSEGLVFTCGDGYRYESESGATLYAGRHDLVCLPAGSRYRHVAQCPRTVRTVVVNFSLQRADGEALRLSDDVTKWTMPQPQRLLAYFEELDGEYRRQTDCPARLKVTLYRLLLELCTASRLAGGATRSAALLLPALRHLEQHAPQQVRVRELARLCHVSENCFRRHFLAYTGALPTQYLQGQVLGRALALLADPGLTVAEVADLLGFEDVSYFSRFVRRMTGKPPSAHR